MSFDTIDFSVITTFFASLTVSKLLPAILIVAVAYFAIKFINTFFDKFIGKTKIPANFHGVLRTTTRFALWTVALLMAASSLGFDVTSLVAVFTVLSLAFSLAIQGALSNVAGGFTVLTTQPFQVGEFVEIGGVSGVIQEIGIVYTKLATVDNKIVLVPNSEVASSKIVNYTSGGTRRVDMQFSASYDDNIDTVKDALRSACLLPMVLTDPAPFVAVNSYGDHAICYDVRVWVNAADYWDAFYGVTNNVKVVFDQTHIAMTYPHLNVHMDK
ncbi:MAG: mechanosensitive ion channel family protein [Eubacteriales bacterium]